MYVLSLVKGGDLRPVLLLSFLTKKLMTKRKASHQISCDVVGGEPHSQQDPGHTYSMKTEGAGVSLHVLADLRGLHLLPTFKRCVDNGVANASYLANLIYIQLYRYRF